MTLRCLSSFSSRTNRPTHSRRHLRSTLSHSFFTTCTVIDTPLNFGRRLFQGFAHHWLLAPPYIHDRQRKTLCGGRNDFLYSTILGRQRNSDWSVELVAPVFVVGTWTRKQFTLFSTRMNITSIGREFASFRGGDSHLQIIDRSRRNACQRRDGNMVDVTYDLWYRQSWSIVESIGQPGYVSGLSSESRLRENVRRAMPRRNEITEQNGTNGDAN